MITTSIRRFLPRSRTAVGAVGALLLGWSATACSPSSLVDVTASASIIDPASVRTPSGANSVYLAAVGKFAALVGGGPFGSGNVVTWVGVFTDEYGGTSTGTLAPTGIDVRNVTRFVTTSGTVTNVFSTPYNMIQAARIQAQQAHGVLERYLPGVPALAGNAFAMEGYTELVFGELFCSGVPLSTAGFDEEFQYAPGSSTDEMLTHAATLFDSAIAKSADSARILNFARVEKGRALLQLGQFSAAAAAVQAVPTAFAYNLEFSASVSNQSNFIGSNATSATVIDREGSNGLPWISAHDARVVIATSGTTARSQKYTTATAPVTIASGIEARLIEAEAALHNNDVPGWAAILNTLRATAISPAIPALTADSTTTASPDMRLDVTFRERAFWLYATGHRQGDLRRLVHVYGRDPQATYPVGPTYGIDFVAQPAATEASLNPLYHGCFDSNL